MLVSAVYQHELATGMCRRWYHSMVDRITQRTWIWVNSGSLVCYKSTGWPSVRHDSGTEHTRMCPLRLEALSRLLPRPAPRHGHRAQGLNSLRYTASFPWLSDFMCGHVCVSINPLNSAHPLLAPTVSTSLFSVCISVAACRWVHQFHLSRFHIYALIYDICLSLSDLTSLYNRL